MALNISLSCECDDLMEEVISISSKDYSEVESAFMTLGIYPESNKTFISWNNDKKDSIIVDYNMKENPELKWVDDALVQIFKTENIDSIYITCAI